MDPADASVLKKARFSVTQAESRLASLVALNVETAGIKGNFSVNKKLLRAASIDEGNAKLPRHCVLDETKSAYSNNLVHLNGSLMSQVKKAFSPCLILYVSTVLSHLHIVVWN